MKNLLKLSLLLGLPCNAALASSPAQPTLDPLKMEVYQGSEKLSGDTLRVLIHIPKGWHLTSNQPKSEYLIAMETKVQSQNLEFKNAVYPTPIITPMPALGFDGSWFEDSLVVKFPVKSVKKEAWDNILFEINFQACTDKMCIAPRTETLELSAAALAQSFENPKVASETNPNTNAQQDHIPWRTLLQFLAFAFMGGMILNLMPCVLPVLGLKVFALVQKRGASRMDLAIHALVFTLGTLVSFWILAAAMIALKSIGNAVGWGFQFQEPGYVILMAILVTLFALNLFGLFEVSLGWKTQTSLDGATRKEGYLGAFFNGTFMTLLATPCTAPMLSPAMGFAFSQPDWVLCLFMSVVALGLAFPFALVCLVPKALQIFPKPGAWMMRLKEFLGFLLLFTLAWLLYVFGQQAGNYSLSILIVLLMGIALFAWIWSHIPHHVPPLKKSLFLGFALMFLAWVGLKENLLPATAEYIAENKAKLQSQKGKSSESQNPNNPYKSLWTPGKVKELNAKGIDVFVDFTADWCISCHANEKIALAPAQVDQHFKAGKPVLLIGDYTHSDPDITAELKKFGRSGVPMYVLYKADGTTEVLPEVITPQMVLKTILKQ
jgi:thiol:disulfide interchange protein